MNHNELLKEEGYDPRNVMKNSLINEGVFHYVWTNPFILLAQCFRLIADPTFIVPFIPWISFLPKEEVILIREQSLKNTSYLQRERESQETMSIVRSWIDYDCD